MTGNRVLEWAQSRRRRRGLRPRDAAILIGAAWLVTIAVFGILERLVEPKEFSTVWLGMWWALQTVTTVGYGDIVPATTAGRAIASLLLLGGLAFLTVIIAMITGGFVSRYQRQAAAAGEDPTVERIEQLSTELAAVRAELRELRREASDRVKPT